MKYIACDIGGTNMRIAVSSDCKKFDEPFITETPKNVMDGIHLIGEKAKEMLGGKKPYAAVVGIAGALDPKHEKLTRTFHLTGWEGVALKTMLEHEFGSPVHLQNDAALVGLGEATAGAGKGYPIVVYMTISTGIGGVKIVDGIIEKGKYTFEPGFQILDINGNKNFEELASGTAVEAKFHMHPREVAKTPEWSQIEDYVAVGIHNSILHWSPDVVVVGGSMAKDLRAEILTEKISKLMKIHPELPKIKIAELGSLGGIWGGFNFLKRKYLS